MNTTFEATNSQYYALEMARETFGRQRKAKLRVCWGTGMYPRSLSQYKAELQQVRNNGGSAWLTQFRFGRPWPWALPWWSR
jgi:hypothetical protein